MLSDLQQAISALDLGEGQGASSFRQPAADSRSDDSLLADGVSPPPAPAPAHISLLHQVTREIAALNDRNMALQHEIDSLSVASSSPHPSPQRAAAPARPALLPRQPAGKLTAGSHTLLPRTPDLSHS